MASSSRSSDSRKSETYNTIDDVRKSTIRTVSSELSVATSNLGRTGTPTTPRSNRSFPETPPTACRYHLPCCDKPWPPLSQTPPLQHHVANPDVKRTQQMETHAQVTPTLARRFNSAPLPEVPPQLVPRSNSTPYVKFNNTKMQF